MVITGVVGVLLMVVYRYLCVWDNHQRDKTGVMEAYEHAYEDDLTDKKVYHDPRRFSDMCWNTVC